MACCYCQLVDIACVRRRSQFEDSVRDEQLLTHIIHAHEIELYYVIGQSCIDELCLAKQNNTLTELQTQLISLIESFLTEIISIRYLGKGRVKMHAGGGFVMNPSGANNVDGGILGGKLINTNLEYHIRDANFYYYRIKEFINDNINDFLCYPASCCNSCNNVICCCRPKTICSV